jgi:TRAP-type C4-dicarboxylate transport system permease small subunit
MRRFLDLLYLGSGVIAALSLVSIFALVAVQVAMRLVDAALKLAGLQPTGFIIPSIAEICGFLLACASFMALAYTLRRGGHIRVGIVVEHLPKTLQRPLELLVGLAATALAARFTWALAGLTAKSWQFNDVSYGFLPIPLWLPQGAMALGLAILTLALIDETLAAWRERRLLAARSEA